MWEINGFETLIGMILFAWGGSLAAYGIKNESFQVNEAGGFVGGTIAMIIMFISLIIFDFSNIIANYPIIQQKVIFAEPVIKNEVIFLIAILLGFIIEYLLYERIEDE